jgi:hypothetical protein
MSSYTKLFRSIIHSTIWRADDSTRLVWVTMLALADRDGMVEASIPGLADAARVTVTQCHAALVTLLAPDHYSRSQEDEGRRIREVPGGWALVNYVAHRERYGKEERRENARERQRLKRERDRHAKSQPSRAVTKSNIYAEAEAEREPPSPLPEQNEAKAPARRDLMALSLNPLRADVLELHAAYRAAFGLAHHKLTGSTDVNALHLSDAIDAHGLAACLLVLRYAPEDGMVSGKADERGQKHEKISYVFGNPDTFARILRAAESREGKASNQVSGREAAARAREL